MRKFQFSCSLWHTALCTWQISLRTSIACICKTLAGFSPLLYDVVIQNCDTVLYILFAVCVYNFIDWQALLKPRFHWWWAFWGLTFYGSSAHMWNYHINNISLWKNHQWLTHLICCSPTSVSSVQRISSSVTYI